MVRGITNSKLLSDMHERTERDVPIGQNILTNDSAAVSEKILPLTRGQPVTSLHMDQFDVFGRSRQNKAAVRDSSENNVAFQDREQINDGLVADAGFDDTNGLLNIVKQNSEVLVINGFLTQSDFGRGATGPQGARGFDGYEGDDGDDGPDGGAGCEGPKGETGLIGEMGEPGKDGPPGIPGPMGQEGWTGLQGPPGDMGRIGHEGARGPKGHECLSDGGADGENGRALNGSVVINSSEPSSDSVLWGIPGSGGGGGGTPAPNPSPEPPAEPPKPSVKPSTQQAAGIAFNCTRFIIAGHDTMYPMFSTKQFSESNGKPLIYHIPQSCAGQTIILRIYNSDSYGSAKMSLYLDFPKGELYKSITVGPKESGDMLIVQDERFRTANCVHIESGGPATLSVHPQ